MELNTANNNLGAYVSVSHIVNSMQNELQIFDESSTLWFGQLIIEGLIELNMTSNHHNIEVDYFTVNDIGEIDFPIDMLDYTKIGVNLNGQIWTLTLNPKIIPNRKEDCGYTLAEIGNGSHQGIGYGGYYFADHYNNGSYIGGLYGKGGGLNVGYYNIDYAKRKFIIRGLPAGQEVVIEYASTGIKPGNQTVVHRSLMYPAKAYAHWKRIEHRENISEGAKQRKLDQLSVAINRMSEIQSTFTLSEYMDASYRDMRGTIKR